MFFRRKKGLKSDFFVRWRQACTAVSDTQLNAPVLRPIDSNKNCAPLRRSILHCVHRVHKNIEQYLLQLHSVAAYGWDIGPEIVADTDPAGNTLTVH